MTTLIAQGAGRRWAALRTKVITRDRGQCVNCGSTNKLQVDHIIERQHGGTDDMANLQTLCTECHKRKSAINSQSKKKKEFYGRSATPRPLVSSSLSGSGSGVKLSGDESPGYPRMWPDPHPDAVGTRGGELAEYAAQVIGQPLLPWQADVADELLAVDAAGRWVHTSAMILVPRQSGKTTLLRALCEWLAAVQGQVVLCTSAKLANVAHLMRPSQLRYRSEDGYRVLFSKEQPEVNYPGWDEESHRWIGQAATSMFGRGFTVGTAVLDEAQDVPVEALEAVSPSLVEVENPLVVMTGTAPRTGDENLLRQQRDLALAGGPVALFEWSAPDGADWRDEEVWRAASPRWTAPRVRRLREEVAKGDESAFRTEYLCQPVGGALAAPWVDFKAWQAARAPLGVPERVDVAAVEDGRGGLGGSVALAWVAHGVVSVVALTTGTLDEAWAYALRAERVLCGITLRNEESARSLRAKPAGRRETASALPELRRLLHTGALRWDGDDLDSQMRAVVVREDSAGSLTVGSGTPTGALRAAAWAVQSVRITRDPVLI